MASAVAQQNRCAKMASAAANKNVYCKYFPQGKILVYWKWPQRLQKTIRVLKSVSTVAKYSCVLSMASAGANKFCVPKMFSAGANKYLCMENGRRNLKTYLCIGNNLRDLVATRGQRWAAAGGSVWQRVAMFENLGIQMNSIESK